MKMKITLFMMIMLFMLACTGCGTIIMRGSDLGEELYPATRGDLLMIHLCLESSVDGPIAIAKLTILTLLAVIDIPISLATDTVLLPFDLFRRHNIRQRNDERQRTQEEIDKLVSVIRQNPSTVFDKQWHTSNDPLVMQAVRASLYDKDTLYTVEMLERLVIESPRYKENVFAHPLCPTHLLVENFQDAYDKALKASYVSLGIIVSNPNTPIEMVEKVANSKGMPVGAVYPARDALKRRQKQQDDGQQRDEGFGSPVLESPSPHR